MDGWMDEKPSLVSCVTFFNRSVDVAGRKSRFTHIRNGEAFNALRCKLSKMSRGVAGIK